MTEITYLNPISSGYTMWDLPVEPGDDWDKFSAFCAEKRQQGYYLLGAMEDFPAGKIVVIGRAALPGEVSTTVEKEKGQDG